MDEKRQIDHRLKGMLREFGKALSEAISDSPELGRSLKQIRDEGFALFLLVENQGDGEPSNTVPFDVTAGDDGAVAFRINSEDLAFLRSIGIDPTRTLRRRKPAEASRRPETSEKPETPEKPEKSE